MVEVEERIRALRLIFGHKQELLRLLANEFNLHLPKKALQKFRQGAIDANGHER